MFWASFRGVLGTFEPNDPHPTPFSTQENDRQPIILETNQNSRKFSILQKDVRYLFLKNFFSKQIRRSMHVLLKLWIQFNLPKSSKTDSCNLLHFSSTPSYIHGDFDFMHAEVLSRRIFPSWSPEAIFGLPAPSVPRLS